MDGDQRSAGSDVLIGELADNGTMPVLVVDLDGTLIRTDMLAESFWAACSSDILTPLKLIPKAFKGRAALKRDLSAKARFDPVTLPYNKAVIDYILAWKKRGGRTALVSASDENIVRAIGEHLGIFDEIHGSDGKLNLKGSRKAQFLTERFGEAGYAYMGDSRADIPVWKSAAKAITVNAGRSLRSAAEAACQQADHIATNSKSLRPILKAIRPHQWLKNMLVFIPMIAGHRIDATTLLQSSLAFVCFSLIASSVYLLNDLLDLSADRAHPRKHRRPLASGDLPLIHGTLLAPVLLMAGIGLGTILGPPFLVVMAGYYTVTMAYSFFLKRRVLIDIVTLAGLYTIRILAGSAATGDRPLFLASGILRVPLLRSGFGQAAGGTGRQRKPGSAQAIRQRLYHRRPAGCFPNGDELGFRFRPGSCALPEFTCGQRTLQPTGSALGPVPDPALLDQSHGHGRS
jgi:phosphoserine phosphatase